MELEKATLSTYFEQLPILTRNVEKVCVWEERKDLLRAVKAKGRMLAFLRFIKSNL
jgi:hypothetical protein